MGMEDDLIRAEFGERILLELDVAIGMLGYGRNRRFLDQALFKMYRRMPETWFQMIPFFLPDTKDRLRLFEMLSLVCPADLLCKDYESVTGYLRGMTALDWIRFSDKVWKESIGDALMAAMEKHTRGAGDALMNEACRQTALRIEEMVVSETQGKLFWFLVDAFFWRHYQPWRVKKMALVEGMGAQLRAVMGADGRCSLNALLALLPKTNALHYRASLRRLLLDGSHRLVFWLEPFGLHDAWVVQHGEVIVSVCEGGALYSRIREAVEAAAERNAALSHPTRLGILRIIRHADMDITEIADYFGLARPTVSRHMKVLRSAGLVSGYDDGRSVKHRVDGEKVRALFEELRGMLEISSGN